MGSYRLPKSSSQMRSGGSALQNSLPNLRFPVGAVQISVHNLRFSRGRTAKLTSQPALPRGRDANLPSRPALPRGRSAQLPSQPALPRGGPGGGGLIPVAAPWGAGGGRQFWQRPLRGTARGWAPPNRCHVWKLASRGALRRGWAAEPCVGPPSYARRAGAVGSVTQISASPSARSSGCVNNTAVPCPLSRGGVGSVASPWGGGWCQSTPSTALESARTPQWQALIGEYRGKLPS